MAGQFDKFIKILGGGAKPDRAVGTWKGTNKDGGPAGTPVEISIPVGVPERSYTDPNGGGRDTNITEAAVNVARGRKADIEAGIVETGRNVVRNRARKRQIEGLATTTMRLNEKTGEAYDTEEVKPAPSARVMPTRRANPKYLAADAQRQNEDLAAATEEYRKRNVVGLNEDTGETEFNKGEAAKGSTLRSVNGVTYDMKDYSDYLDSVKANEIAKARAPYDISDFEPGSAKPAPAASAERPSSIVPTKPLNSKMADNREDEIDVEHQENFKAVREYEQKGKGKTTVEYGDTLSKANTEGTNPYNEDGSVKAEYDDPNTIYSTTMHEHNGEIVEGGVHKAPYKKPEVKKTGNVIPQTVLDTYTGSDSVVDEEQAKKERRNRTPLTRTGPYDPNKTPGRDTFGRTPERRAVQGAIREQRAADLASQGKEMTTVAPHIMRSAVALARSSRFGINDESYLSSTAFLDHPAVQEATIAHAFGVHHDFSILHRALGGRAPEINRRRNAWFKVADRKLRGNPEKVPGEFDALGAAIRKGTTPTTVVRKLEQGKKPGITINGQAPTLAEDAPIADVQTPTRAGTRRMHANTAANMMYQQQQAEREAHRIMTFTPLKTTTMRLNEATGEAYDSENPDEVLKNTPAPTGTTIAPAGSDMVTVRNKNNPDAPPVTRPFTKAERLNKGNVPSVDDSKRRL